MAGTGRQGVDIAIVGGGIIGCTLAFELAHKGISAAVIERGEIGREASWASAGIISPPSSPAASALRVELTSRTIAAYPRFVATVQEETGIDVGYRRFGELTIARDEREVAALRDLVAWQVGLGFNAEWVDANALGDLEPVLPAGVLGAALANEAGGVILHHLTRAAAIAAARRGTTIIEHTPALGIALEGERAVGVRLPDGVLPAGQVVLAAGAWTAGFGADLGRALPTKPVKGQMMAVVDAPVMPRHIVGGPGGYLVPRTDGSVAVGATIEAVGFDKRVTPAGLRELVDLAASLAPALLRGEVAATWAGLRPGTADGDPLLGSVPGYERLWVAAGHYRVGAQTAIGTTELMVSSLLAGQPDPLLAAASPSRFGGE